MFAMRGAPPGATGRDNGMDNQNLKIAIYALGYLISLLAGNKLQPGSYNTYSMEEVGKAQGAALTEYNRLNHKEAKKVKEETHE
jgi:hypothetical protein